MAEQCQRHHASQGSVARSFPAFRSKMKVLVVAAVSFGLQGVAELLVESGQDLSAKDPLLAATAMR
jgi:hypothetical protein